MLSDTITLKTVSGTEDFTLVSAQGPDVTRVSATPVYPNRHEFIIRGSSSNRKLTNGAAYEQKTYNFLLKRQLFDTANNPATAQLSVTITKPNVSWVSKADIYDMIRQMIDLLSSTETVAVDTSFVDRILLGER